MALLDGAVGVLLVVGALVLLRAGRMPAGWLLLLGGVAWFVPSVASAPPGLLQVHRGLLVAAALALLPSRRTMAAGGLAVLTSAVPALQGRTGPSLAWAAAVAGAAILLTSGLPPRVRPVATLPPLLLALTVGSAASLTMLAGPAARDATALVYLLGVGASGFAVVSAGLWLRPQLPRIADAVVEVVAVDGSSSRLVLAEALRDERVDLAIASGGGWVDDAGRPRGPVTPRPGYARLPVRVAGALVAELVLREDLARAPAVAESVASAARLLAEQLRLRAGLRTEAEALAESRRRLVVVDGEERAALATRLSSVTAEAVAGVRTALATLPASRGPELNTAREAAERRLEVVEAELGRLAAGLGPAATEPGRLGPALASLVEPLGIAVDLRVDPELDVGQLTTVVYLVCAEAVANAVRHSRARRLTVTCGRVPDGLELVVADDGRGGAHLARGGGLAGLRDRVAALGGDLSLRSEAGGGTEVRVTIPTPRGQAGPIRVHGCP